MHILSHTHSLSLSLYIYISIYFICIFWYWDLAVYICTETPRAMSCKACSLSLYLHPISCINAGLASCLSLLCTEY